MFYQRTLAAITALSGAAILGLFIAHPDYRVFVLAVVLLMVGAAQLWSARRLPHGQRALIHAVWALARQLPEGPEVIDPLTGRGLRADRRDGYLTVMVRDNTPPATNALLVTRYLVGFLGRPAPAPVLRAQVVLDANHKLNRISWRRAATLGRFARASGALSATSEELSDLHDQLLRALDI